VIGRTSEMERGRRKRCISRRVFKGSEYARAIRAFLRLVSSRSFLVKVIRNDVRLPLVVVIRSLLRVNDTGRIARILVRPAP